MKSIFNLAAAASIFALSLAVPAVAQQKPGTFHVPFSFNVGARAFPAGEYGISTISPGSVMVQIRAVGNSASAMAMAATFAKRPSSQSPDAKLVFRLSGGQHFLSQVWFRGDDTGLTLPISESELEYAKQTSAENTVLQAKK
jgi:hypothetical protein